MVFDRMFGTFAAERDDLPCRYGLVTPLRSNLWRARSWRERLACVIGAPAAAPANPVQPLG